MDNGLTITTRSFSYNTRSELTSDADGVLSYDSQGNRVTGYGVAYQANALNQYTNAGVATWTYDADGNPLSDGTRTFVYDAENRLIQVGSFHFTYDYNHRLVKLVGDLRPFGGYLAQPTTSWRLFDRNRLVAREDVRTYYSQHAIYSWGLDLAGDHAGGDGTGGLLVIETSMGKYKPRYDGRGNIWGFSGGVSHTLNAFGEITFPSMTLPGSTPIALLSYGQGTKEHLQEVNLYHYGRRFYDPKQGRFIGRDPIQEEGGINLYAFVKNQPLNRWDRLGLCDNLDATTGACLTERPADLLSPRTLDPFIASTTPYKTVVYAPGAISPLAFAAGGGASGGSQANGGGATAPNKTESSPTTKNLVDKLRQLPCEQRQQFLDQARAAFDTWGDMQSEFTQVIFGGKDEALTSVSEVLAGDKIPVYDSFVFNSGPVLTRYFSDPTVQQTIQQLGLAAIFMSHSEYVNTSNLPSNLARLTLASPVPTVLYNPRSVTVISASVQPLIDQSGSRSAFRGAQPVLSSSPGIEVTSSELFLESVMEGCK
ncbi:MAG TPA: RHS repeat-associated core domain-containing protein [Opitutaceae bacterium]|nr:RHS repeat-associated core domain-containing protein [Opitutaceae bacterium]